MSHHGSRHRSVGADQHYGTKRGVIDLSFEVREGQVFGFLGPNGAGKTTTIRLLMALLVPGSGRASIGGLDCWRESVQVKRLVGYLPGELSLDPNLTGGQILTYFANLRGGVDPDYVGSWSRASTSIRAAASGTTRTATSRRSDSSRRSCTARVC